MHRLQELVRLHRMGQGAREAARLLGMSPNTERGYREALQQAGLLEGDPENLPDAETLKLAVSSHKPAVVPEQQTSSIQDWHSQVVSMTRAGVGPRAIYDRLRTQEEDFKGSLSAVKRMVLAIKRETGPSAESVAIPVETAPGDVAQVDFGYVGLRWDTVERRLRKSWVFVMVLGYSRHLYAEVVFRQDTQTWLALHERAFRAYDGVPRTVVPDNLKAAVIRAAFDVGGGELNRSYRELARHYGFKIDPTPPRAPKKKGKVEAGVKYVKSNGLAGRGEEPLEDSNQWLSRWTREVAGLRTHGTTGKQPLRVFEAEEQSVLLPLPASPYDPVVWKEATVHQDSHVAFERRLYSVPWRYLGRRVWLRATASTLAVYADDERVATHRRTETGYGRVTDEAHLPTERGNFRHRSRDYWEERADRMGEPVGRFIREVFDADEVLSQLRPVQSIVTLLERHPVERARAASERASFFGGTDYRTVKNILTLGLDFQPLPPVRPGATEWADEPPRFARPADEWLETEVSSEHH